METYIYDRVDWPHFRWDRGRLTEPLAALSRQQGRFVGHMESLGFNLREDAVLRTLTTDVVSTSAIEGERLDVETVRSSIARRMGVEIAGLKPADRNVEGVVEMTLDATRNYAEPLEAERLFGWHAGLFPTGRSGMAKIRTGAWRDDHNGPMQVVSGPIGRETVHYEAPAASRLEGEMAAFFKFLNGDDKADAVFRAALAHFWFVTVHPFDDGNGRIARALADMQLARSDDSSQRFYSMSRQIREEREAYYETLARVQRGTMDITFWMEWFLGCLGRSITRAQETLGTVLAKAKVWDSARSVALNERQRQMLNRLLDGFEGNLNTVQWAKLAKCSHDTALRDIQDLLGHGILKQNPGGGRSTSYALA